MKALSSKTNGQWLAVAPPLPPVPGAAQPAAPILEDPAKAEAKRALSDVMRCSNLVVLAGLGTSLCVQPACCQWTKGAHDGGPVAANQR